MYILLFINHNLENSSKQWTEIYKYDNEIPKEAQISVDHTLNKKKRDNSNIIMQSA